MKPFQTHLLLILMPALALAEEAAKQPAALLKVSPTLTLPLAPPPKPFDAATATPWEFLEKLGAALNSDAEEEARHKLLAIRQAVKMGHFEAALKMAHSQPDTRKAGAFAEMAWLLATSDGKQHSPLCLEESTKWLSQAPSRQLGDALAWQVGAHASMEQTEKAAALLTQIQDDFELLRAKGLALRYDSTKEKMDAFLAETSETAALPQIDLLIHLAGRALDKKERSRAVELTMQAAERALKMKKINGYARIGEIVKFWLQHGDLEEAAKHWTVFEKAARIFAASEELGAILLAEASVLAFDGKRQDTALALAADAETSAAKVFALYAPEAWIAAARARHHAGDEEKAVIDMRKALQVAAGYPHPRAKAMGAFRVCLFAYETGIKLTEDDRAVLKTLLHG